MDDLLSKLRLAHIETVTPSTLQGGVWLRFSWTCRKLAPLGRWRRRSCALGWYWMPGTDSQPTWQQSRCASANSKPRQSRGRKRSGTSCRRVCLTVTGVAWQLVGGALTVARREEPAARPAMVHLRCGVESGGQMDAVWRRKRAGRIE